MQDRQDQAEAKRSGFEPQWDTKQRLVICADQRVGPFDLNLMQLEVPGGRLGGGVGPDPRPFDRAGDESQANADSGLLAAVRNERTRVRRLEVALGEPGLQAWLQAPEVAAAGFRDVAVVPATGYFVFTGVYACKGHQAPFSFRAAPVVRSSQVLDLVFFDARVYGWLPIPSACLPGRLWRALGLESGLRVDDEAAPPQRRAGAVALAPVAMFMRHLLPRHGWKVPDCEAAKLVSATVAEGGLRICAGEGPASAVAQGSQETRRHGGQPDSHLGIGENAAELPAVARLASEAVLASAPLEAALGREDLSEAFALSQRAFAGHLGGSWSSDRLLQVGVTRPEFAVSTMEAAERMLAGDGDHLQAHLALGALYARSERWLDAARSFRAVADLSPRQGGTRFDTTAALMAAARCAAHSDVGLAGRCYEMVTAASPRCLEAQRALFDLRTEAKAWSEAAAVGETLLTLLAEGTGGTDGTAPLGTMRTNQADAVAQRSERASVASQLGDIYRLNLDSPDRALAHLETCFDLGGGTLEQLQIWASLKLQVSGKDAAASGLRQWGPPLACCGDSERDNGIAQAVLGDLWLTVLEDLDAATTHYGAAIQTWPDAVGGHLGLAAVAQRRCAWPEAIARHERAVRIWEDALQVSATSAEGGVLEDVARQLGVASAEVLLAGRLALAQLYLRSPKASDEAAGRPPNGPPSNETEALARDHARRVVALAPGYAPGVDTLAQSLTALETWSEAAGALSAAVETAPDEATALRWGVQAALLWRDHGDDPVAARRQLEVVLERQSDHAEALAALVPILTAEGEYDAVARRLQRAAQRAAEKGNEALQVAWMFDVCEVRRLAQAPWETQRQALEDVLAVAPKHLGAARRLVTVLGHLVAAGAANVAEPLEATEDRRRVDLRVLGHAYDRVVAALDTPEAKAEALVTKARGLWPWFAQAESDGGAAGGGLQPIAPTTRGRVAAASMIEAALRHAVRTVSDALPAWQWLSFLHWERGQESEANELLAHAVRRVSRRLQSQTSLAAAVRARLSQALGWAGLQLAGYARAEHNAAAEAAQLAFALGECGFRFADALDRLVDLLCNDDRLHDAAQMLELWCKDPECWQPRTVLPNGSALVGLPMAAGLTVGELGMHADLQRCLRLAQLQRQLGKGDRAVALARAVAEHDGDIAGALAGCELLFRFAQDDETVSLQQLALERRLQLLRGDPPLAVLLQLVDVQWRARDTAAAHKTAVRCATLALADGERLPVLVETILLHMHQSHGAWASALDVVERLLAHPDVTDAAGRDALHGKAVALAEVAAAPGRRRQLVGAWQRERDGSQDDALAVQGAQTRGEPVVQGEVSPRQLSDLLEEEQDWSGLSCLLNEQLDRAEGSEALTLHQRLGTLLSGPLAQPEAAMPHLETVLRGSPDEGALVAEMLAPIYSKLGEFTRLAALSSEAARTSTSAGQALHWTLLAVKGFLEAEQPARAHRSLRRLVAQHGDALCTSDALHDVLSQTAQWDLLVTVLEGAVSGLSPGGDAAALDDCFARLVDALAGPLKQLEQAWGWCERWVQALGRRDDAPFLAQLELCSRAGLLGSTAVLSDPLLPLRCLALWGQWREGEPRQEVLRRMVGWIGQEGGDALRAWEMLATVVPVVDGRASDASLEVVDAVLKAFVRHQSWFEALDWSQAAVAQGVEEGAQDLDGRRRQLLEIATQHCHAPRLALQAAVDLERPTEEELLLFANLCLEQEQFALLLGHERAVAQLDQAALLRILQRVGRTNGASQEAATDEVWAQLAEHALALALRASGDPADLDTWLVAFEVWQERDALLRLGLLRRRYARGAKPADQAWLRVMAAVEMTAGAGGRGEDATAAIGRAVSKLDITNAAHAWAALQAGVVCATPAWVERGVGALRTLYGDGDGQLARGLRLQVRDAVSRGSYDTACALVEKMVSWGHAGAETLLVEVFERAGRRLELAALLEDQLAEGSDGHTKARSTVAAVWVPVLARLHHEAGKHERAAAILERLPLTSRNKEWAQVAFSVACDQEDWAAAMHAAQLAASLCGRSGERAWWQRTEASLRWWRLNDIERARELLMEAQRLAPLSVAQWEKRAQGTDLDAGILQQDGVQVLHEALASLQPVPSVQAPLWLRLAEATDDPDALERAAAGMTGCFAVAKAVAELASSWGDGVTAVRGWEAAWAVQPIVCTEPLVHALLAEDAWERAVEVLQSTAQEAMAQERSATHSGVADAELVGRWWSWAAEITLEHAGRRSDAEDTEDSEDPEDTKHVGGTVDNVHLWGQKRALGFLVRAAQVDPCLAYLEGSARLAGELQTWDVAEAQAKRWLAHAERDAEASQAARLAVLRVYVAALEALKADPQVVGSALEALAVLDGATSSQLTALGELWMDSEPQRAADFFARALGALDDGKSGAPEHAQGEQTSPAAHVALRLACAWMASGLEEQAREALRRCLALGGGCPPAWRLGLKILPEPERTSCAREVLAHGADAGAELLDGGDGGSAPGLVEWTPGERATVRRLVALAELEAGWPAQARKLLESSSEFETSLVWAQAMEAVLEDDAEPVALARFWMQHATLWDLAGRRQRLRQAASVLANANAWTEEAVVLEQLAQDSDLSTGERGRVLERLTQIALQADDPDLYRRCAERDIAGEGNEEARARATVRHANIIASQLERAEVAGALLAQRYRIEPSLVVARSWVTLAMRTAAGVGVAEGPRGLLAALVGDWVCRGTASGESDNDITLLPGDAAERGALLELAAGYAESVGSVLDGVQGVTSDPALNSTASSAPDLMPSAEHVVTVLYAALLRLVPDHPDAVSAVTKLAERDGRIEDAVEIYQRAGLAALHRDDASTVAQGLAWLLRGADLAADPLGDRAQEVRLLGLALAASGLTDHQQASIAPRYVRGLLVLDDLDGAWAVMQRRLCGEAEVELAAELAELLGQREMREARAPEENGADGMLRSPEINRGARAAVVWAWIAEHHPSAPEVLGHAFEEAWAEHNWRAVAGVAQRWLSLEGRADVALRPHQRGKLHHAAGLACAALERWEEALSHFASSLKAPEPDLEWLLDAFDFAADRAGTAGVLQAQVVRCAVGRRSALSIRAGSRSGYERTRCLGLLGRVHEAVGDHRQAAAVYEEILEMEAPRSVHPAHQALCALYRRQASWRLLLETLEGMLQLPDLDTDTQVALQIAAGDVWRIERHSARSAVPYYEAAVLADPSSYDAQRSLGLALSAVGEHARARKLLQLTVDVANPEVDDTDLEALLLTLRECGLYEEALEVVAALQQRAGAKEAAGDREQGHLLAERASLLEALGKNRGAQAAWLAYLDTDEARARGVEAAPVWRRLGEQALQRQDWEAAGNYLERALDLAPEDLTNVAAARQLSEVREDWPAVVGWWVRESELMLGALDDCGDDSGDDVGKDDEAALLRKQAADALLAAAQVAQRRLDAPQQMLDLQERAAQLVPDRMALRRALFEEYARAGEWTLARPHGDALWSAWETGDLEDSFLVRYRDTCAELGDSAVACSVAERLWQRHPDDVAVRGGLSQLAREARNWALFAQVEQLGLDEGLATLEQERHRQQAEADTEESGEGNAEVLAYRCGELAEVYAVQLDDQAQAAALLRRAHVLVPEDLTLRRKLADVLALETSTYDEALAHYRALLVRQPRQLDVLRIAARLCGQLGDTKSAYALYGILMLLQPGDSETRRFVEGCRSQRSWSPPPVEMVQRVLTASAHPAMGGRVDGLIQHALPILDIWDRCVGSGARTEAAPLPVSDARVRSLRPLLESLSMPDHTTLYLWRRGGFGCRVDWADGPAVLLGSALATDPSPQARAFMLTRTVLLHQHGLPGGSDQAIQQLYERLAALQLWWGWAGQDTYQVATAGAEEESGVAARMLSCADAMLECGIAANVVAALRELERFYTTGVRARHGHGALDEGERWAASAGSSGLVTFEEVASWAGGCIATVDRAATTLTCDIEEAARSLLRCADGVTELDAGSSALDGILGTSDADWVRDEVLDLLRWVIEAGDDC